MSWRSESPRRELELSDDLVVSLADDPDLIPLATDQWNALLGTSETNTVFQTREWFDAWWQAFGAKHQLYFLTVIQSKQVIGFAALMLTPCWRGHKRLEFVGTGNADYLDIVSSVRDKPRVIRAICRFLLENRGDWWSAWLASVPSESKTTGILRTEGFGGGIRMVFEAQIACCSLDLEKDPEWGRKLLRKYSLRRPVNWFNRQGVVSFRCLTDETEIERYLNVLFELHIRRRSSVGSKSQFIDKRQQIFYSLLAREMNRSGWLHFSVVELSGVPIAIHFGFKYRDVLTWYKPSYDIGVANHSPGLVLLYKLLEEAFERRCKELDFTVGDELFKDRFCNKFSSNLYFSMHHSVHSWVLALVIKASRRALGRVVRSAGAVFNSLSGSIRSTRA